MGSLMDAIHKAAQNALYAEWRAAGKALKAIPGVNSGPNGLTPDSVKQSPEFRAAKAACDQAFQAVRAFNAKYA